MKAKSKVKKTIATFLAATMLTAVLPSVVEFNAVSADTTKNQSNTSLGVSSISNPNKPASKDSAWSGNYVYFGTYDGNPIKFRVLQKDSTAYTDDKSLFLDSDKILFDSQYDSEKYWWFNSSIREKLNGSFLNGFSTVEQAAIAISDGNGGLSYASGSWEEYIHDAPVSLLYDKVFILDASEIINPAYGYSSDNGLTLSPGGAWANVDYTEHNVNNRIKYCDYTGAWSAANSNPGWWIRSYDTIITYVVGGVSSTGISGRQEVNMTAGVAPALNVSQDSIIFSTAVAGESNTYKLTLCDKNLSIAVSPGQKVSVSGTSINVPYSVSGSNSGNATRVSVLLLDKEYTDGNTNGAKIIYYDSLGTTTATSGSFTLPSGYDLSGWGSSYYVYILAEDINGLKESDYASKPVKVSAPPKYTVTFNNSNVGTAPASQTVYNGNKASAPTAPTASGYTFGGWYTDSACTTAYDFNSSVTSNITLYAKWTAVATPAPEPIETPKLTTGVAHVQDIGNVSYTTEAGVLTIGTRGMGKRMEEITINFENTTGLSGTLEYRVHVQDYGWMEWVPAGTKCGTEGESKRIEAIEIRFTGDLADYYSVEYCVHIQDYGDMQGWVKDGALAGTTGESKRIEELKIRIVPKHSGSSMSVKYRVHVQDYGWEGAYASNGQMSGTSGESKRLEGIEIFLDGNQYSGGVKFKTHVQDYGWQGWSYDGEMSGTQGESKRLEGICIELYGEIADYYDIYYRVHAQDIGWMAWAKNGECAGTAGRSARLEGIQIVLVPKGEPAPGATYEGITAVTELAFKEGF